MAPAHPASASASTAAMVHGDAADDAVYEYFLLADEGVKSETVRKILEAHNFHVAEERCDEGCVLKLAASFEDMCVEAESQRLYKLLLRSWEDSLQIPRFSPECSRRVDAIAEFSRSYAAEFQGFKEAATAAGTAEGKHGSAATRFFSCWERSFLTRRLLARAANLPSETIEHASGNNVDDDSDCLPSSEPLLLSLRRQGLVKEAGPLPGARVPLDASLLQSDWVHQVCAAFGPHVAMYFVFMRTFLIWLAPLGCIGFLMWLTRDRTITVDEDTTIPFFSLGVVLWSAAFPGLIQREESKFASQWGCLEAERRDVNRPEFFGELAISPVTGEMDLQYPRWKRMIRYGVTASVTIAALSVPFLAMICSLNLQGYVHPPNSNMAEGLETRSSPFYIKALARFAKPGHVFDPDGGGPLGGWLSLVPTLLHVIVIGLLNATFRRIAERLTEWENHRTESDFEDALIIKRFLFEAFDAYIALFYVGFYMRDPIRLRQELVSLYTMDWLRRLFTESLIPYVQEKVWMAREKRAIGRRKKVDDDMRTPSKDELYLNAYVQKDGYEQFDDYLEMVIGFGYVTLFAGAMPLSAALTFAGNLIEVGSDAFKLNFVCRRPQASRASSMPRPWFFVMCCMCWTAIVTNSLFAYVSSEQVMHLLPSLFKDKGDEHEIRKKGLWILFAGEHLLMIVAFAIYQAMPSRAAWVRHAVAAREFRRLRAAQREMARGKSSGKLAVWVTKAMQELRGAKED